MDTKIANIISLLRSRNFSEAKSKCSEIENSYINNPEFQNIFAVILFELKDYSKSIEKWKKAIDLNSNYFQAYDNLANAFLNLKKYVEALEYFHKAIKINPSAFHVYNNIGNTLTKLNKYKESLDFYDKAIKIKPDNIYGHIFKGHVLTELGKLSESLECYNSAYIINPEHPLLLGYVVHTKTKICDWDNYGADIDLIKNSLEKGKKATYPFTILTILDSPALQKKTAEIWTEQFEKIYKKSHIKLKNKNKNKIRVGYYSADFRNHATSHLIAEMLEYHDKSKFEIFGFYLGRKINYEDPWHERVKKSFDKFFDVSSLTEAQISEISIAEEIDIAIDLMAHCNNGMENRFGAFVIGCAPLQVNFLGYPGTSGAKSIDYIIADKNLISDENKKFYSEKIIYLPNSYQPNVKKTKISAKNLTKEKLGLPNEKFIFCCFNQHQKINPYIYDIWMSILKKNSESILWLLDDNFYSNKNLLSEAEKRGVSKSRIIFAKRVPLEDHLERIKFGDLFLDTFPYTAHTTCSDALRVGLPVLTLKGNSFASRVASSLLKTIKLEELISKNLGEYEIIANKFVTDSDYLRKIKNKLKENLSKTPLYDSQLFTKNLELAYKKIFENYKNNQQLKNFEI